MDEINTQREQSLDFGKSFRQQRPDGLLVSHEHKPAFVCATTNSLVAGLR
jgi:hypothetical protein